MLKYINKLNQFIFRGKVSHIGELYISISVRSFAISLVTVFIPVYLMVLGYSIKTICLYYILTYFFQAACEFFTGKWASIVGAKRVLAISLPVTAINFLFFLSIETYNWPIWVLALSTAIPLSLFYIPYHINFSKAKDQNLAGLQIGKVSILIAIFGALGPIIGGVITQKAGIQLVFILTIILFSLAILPLIGSIEISSKRPISMKNLDWKRNLRDMIGYIGFGLETSGMTIVWPIFIFLLTKSYIQLGLVSSISIAITVILSIMLGKLSDQKDRKKFMHQASLANFWGSLTRIFAFNTPLIYVTSVISGFTHLFFYIPFNSLYYINADHQPRIEYIISMETSIDIGRALGFVTMFLAAFFVEIKTVLIIGLILGSVGSLLAAEIAKNNHKQSWGETVGSND